VVEVFNPDVVVVVAVVVVAVGVDIVCVFNTVSN
jgi:hypothetical protein